MTVDAVLQLALYVVLLIAVTPLLGAYMAKVFMGERVWLTPVLRPIERGLYRLCGIKADEEQHWTTFTFSLLAFNLLGILLLYAILRLQAWLPLNPADMGPVSEHLAFNTAVSFVTNTNWQSYGGESTLSYLTQMLGLTVQNFVSAATGIAVALALIRGFARRSMGTVGNFWVDMVRATLYVLLPLAIVAALFLVWQGMPQTFEPYVTATTLEGTQQIIAEGPVASQVAIKKLGSNGGGFFNVNSAHPYENPTAIANLVQTLFILMIASGLVYTFGRMIGNLRQALAIWIAMFVLFAGGLSVACWAETRTNPAFAELGIDQTASHLAPGGNMEGKEVRFGPVLSALWATTTTDASNGSVNSCTTASRRWAAWCRWSTLCWAR